MLYLDPSTPDGVASNSYRGTQLYNNQFFDYLSEQLPRKIKDMFRWCELVYYNAPIIVNGIRKMVNYPLTDFIYETQSKTIEERTKHFLTKQLDIHAHLINTGLDYYIYGNGFRSIFFPFMRQLRCKSCGDSVNINNTTYKMIQGKFIRKCPSCHKSTISEIVDTPTKDLSEIKIVSWNPYNIDLLSNPITNKIAYYYTIPGDITKGVLTGEPSIVNDTPKLFIDAVLQKKKVKFNNNLFHLRTPFLSGSVPGWGISPLAPTLKLYLHIAVLRKSIEAIGLEHIVPQRILYPEARTSDPTIMTNMAKWKEQIQLAITRWRRDPNYIMLAPYPTGVANIGSQGRALMPTNEIKQAEEDMLRSLDIPPEFIIGTTSINNSTVSLRMLENQLVPYTKQLNNYVNWIIDMVNAEFDTDFCQVKFSSFKLSDDMFKLQTITQLAMSGGNAVSKTTTQELLGLDPERERDQLKDDAINNAVDQKYVERELAQLSSNIQEQTLDEQAASDQGNLPQYNQQKLIARAQQIASDMFSIPYEQRKSQMAQLQNEDYVMWSLVRAQLDTMHTQQNDQTQQQQPQQ